MKTNNNQTGAGREGRRKSIDRKGWFGGCTYRHGLVPGLTAGRSRGCGRSHRFREVAVVSKKESGVTKGIAGGREKKHPKKYNRCGWIVGYVLWMYPGIYPGSAGYVVWIYPGNFPGMINILRFGTWVPSSIHYK